MDNRRPVEWRPWIAGSALVFLAAWLRFYQLGGQSLWIDETMTWLRVSMPLSQVLASTRNGGNLPLSYLLIKPIVDLFGASEFWLRFASALFGVLAVPAAFRLGREAGGQPGGLAAAWLWAVHPMAVFFGRDAKTYGISSGLALLLVALHLHMRRGGQRRWHWLAAFLLLLFGLLSHYYFFFVAALLVVSAAAKFRDDPSFSRGWVFITILSAIPVLLWVAWFYALPEPMLGNGWIDTPIWRDPLLTIWNLFSGYAGVTSMASLVTGGIAASLGAVAIGFSPQRRQFTWLLLLGMLAPTLFMLLISQVKPLYMDRYFIVLLPFVLLIIASGAGRAWEYLQLHVPPVRLRSLATLLFALSLPIGFWIGSSVYSQPQYAKEDWRGLVAYLNAQEDVRIVNTNLAPLFYYQLEFEPLETDCRQACWLVLYRPYMPAHEFTNSIEHAGRPWFPEVGAHCTIIDEWFSPTNVGAWQLQCE